MRHVEKAAKAGLPSKKVLINHGWTLLAAAAPDRRRPAAAARRAGRAAVAPPVHAAQAQLGLTDKTHDGIVTSGNAYRPAGTVKRLPIAYSPEWNALREHTKEIESL